MIIDELTSTIFELKKYNIAIGWLDSTSNSTNLQMIQLTRNLTDWWAFELNFFYDMPGFYDTNIDNLLHKAANKNIDYLLVFSVGTDILDANVLFKKILDYIKNEKFSFVGHVLDRKDFFYKVHPQTILINLNWYKENNMPIFGDDIVESWTTFELNRSEENYHDDYTPLWISKNARTKKYSRKLLGWNFIKTALDSSYPILIFNEDIRQSKKYLYPEDNTSCVSQILSILDKICRPNNFILNNEHFTSFVPQQNIDCSIFTGAGLNAIIIPYLLSMGKDTSVIVYDINNGSLERSKLLVEKYTGQNLKDFFTEHNILDVDYKSIDFIENQNLLDNLLSKDFYKWLTEIKPTINYNFINLNILNEEDWHLLSNNNKQIYINLSNVFTFLPMARLLSLRERINLNNLFFQFLLKSSSNYIVDYRGFYYGDKKLLTPYDLTDVKIPEVMKIFPWNS